MRPTSDNFQCIWIGEVDVFSCSKVVVSMSVSDMCCLSWAFYSLGVVQRRPQSTKVEQPSPASSGLLTPIGTVGRLSASYYYSALT